jgi:hypothetical protein
MFTTTKEDPANLVEKKFVVFDGYYAGIGYQRSAGDYANYTVQLVHWLDDLNTASMANPNFLPGAPYDLSEAAGGWDPAYS